MNERYFFFQLSFFVLVSGFLSRSHRAPQRRPLLCVISPPPSHPKQLGPAEKTEEPNRLEKKSREREREIHEQRAFCFFFVSFQKEIILAKPSLSVPSSLPPSLLARRRGGVLRSPGSILRSRGGRHGRRLRRRLGRPLLPAPPCAANSAARALASGGAAGGEGAGGAVGGAGRGGKEGTAEATTESTTVPPPPASEDASGASEDSTAAPSEE